mgnify:CR=1 FL=1
MPFNYGFCDSEIKKAVDDGANIKLYCQEVETGTMKSSVEVSGNVVDAAKNSDVLITDTWISMGDDTNVNDILTKFAPYQVNHDLMANAGAKVVMHCQPAHRDLEISGSLIDGEQSLLMQQAENRMHGQNAILVELLAKDFEPRN